MIKRLLRGVLVLFVCFCVGTVIALGGMAGYVAVHWSIGRDKLVQMLAVARGIDLAAMTENRHAAPEAAPPEQPSFDRILEARALGLRSIELREQALRGGLEQLRFEQGKIEEQRTALRKIQQTFEENLLALKKEATDTGWEQNRSTLASIKPKQAKELLLQMLERKEIDDVVALLAPMPEGKRAKIVGEFKTPEETKKIDEVLRLIRRGEPATAIAASAQQELQRPAAPGTRGTP